MKTSQKFPLIKLPSETQVALYLIKEELKCRKLFSTLHEIGLDDCYFQPQLNALILQSIGLADYTDDTFTKYDEIVEKRSRKIEASNESIVKQALKAYIELMNLKKDLSAEPVKA